MAPSAPQGEAKNSQNSTYTPRKFAGATDSVMKRFSIQWPLLAAAAVFATAGCGGTSALISGAAKGFITYLQRTVSTDGIVSYVLRRANNDSGEVVDLGSYALGSLVGLFEGPESRLYSLEPAGDDANLVRLDPTGAVSLATLTGGADLVSPGKTGFAFVANASVGAGQPFTISRVPFAGGAAATAFSVNLGSATTINAITANQGNDDVYFAARFSGESDQQIYRVTGVEDTQVIGVNFPGTIKGMQHAVIGSEAYIYFLEDTGADVVLGRINLASLERDNFRTFTGAEPLGMSGDYGSPIVSFNIQRGSDRSNFTIEGTAITETVLTPGGTVTGSVIR